MRSQHLHGAKLSLALCCSSAFCSFNFIGVCRVRTFLDNWANCLWLGTFSLDMMPFRVFRWNSFSSRFILQISDSVTQWTDPSTQALVFATQLTDPSIQASVTSPRTPPFLLTIRFVRRKGLGNLSVMTIAVKTIQSHVHNKGMSILYETDTTND